MRDLAYSTKQHLRAKKGLSLCGCRGDDRILWEFEQIKDNNQNLHCKKCIKTFNQTKGQGHEISNLFSQIR